MQDCRLRPDAREAGPVDQRNILVNAEDRVVARC